MHEKVECACKVERMLTNLNFGAAKCLNDQASISTAL